MFYLTNVKLKCSNWDILFNRPMFREMHGIVFQVTPSYVSQSNDRTKKKKII